MAALATTAVVGMVLVRRWASRILVVATVGLLLITGFSVRRQFVALQQDKAEMLCRGDIIWFGVTLAGPDEICGEYRAMVDGTRQAGAEYPLDG